MKLEGTRWAVAGATGAVGSALARKLIGAEARVALLGRDRERLEALADEFGAPSARFEAREPESCETALAEACEALGGLDGLLVAFGVVAFGPADELDPGVARELFEVNALGPMALIGAAIPRFEGDGVVVAISASVAENPMAGLAGYSAAKAALSGYLVALRRERRRSGVGVIDVRPPHLDTDFAERPLAGTAPELPSPLAVEELTRAIVSAIGEDKREVAFQVKERTLVER